MWAGPANLFGTHVGRGTEDDPRLCRRVRDRRRLRQIPDISHASESLRQPEVQDLDGPVLSHLDVRGLQVAVDHTSFMRGLDGLRNLLRDREGFVQRDGAVGDPVSQRRPRYQLQDQRLRALGFLDAVDGGDAGVVEAGEDLRLALEPGEATT